MTREKYVTYQHKAPYYTLNDLTDATRRVWVAFHGYGQLSRFFLRKFETLNKDENFIISPQGMSKYYQKGFAGRVGANWMTKEDRMTDIANQYTYIDSVLESEAVDWEKMELVYFGFSQGVSTMGRYAVHAGLPFSAMIFWAGAFPPELSDEDFRFRKGGEKFRFFVGNEDPFYDFEREEEERMHLREIFHQDVPITRFEGVHEVKSTLIQLL